MPDPRSAADDVRIAPAIWERDAAALTAVRTTVFVEEQGVPLEIEMDEYDAVCQHVVALDGASQAIGTARMNEAGHIGRVAVLKPWRDHGIGARLVSALIEAARGAGLSAVDLDAQVSAIGFYETLGFESRGDVFLEAGLDHRNMVRPLP